MEGEASPRRRGRLKPILLAAAMAVLALNVWIGSPLLALWIGSRVQGEESQPSMAAFVVVILALVTFSVLLYQLLKLTAGAYREATGTTPPCAPTRPGCAASATSAPTTAAGPEPTTSRAPSAWSSSRSSSRRPCSRFWFFFFSGSPIGTS
jgi:hypothetical protein